MNAETDVIVVGGGLAGLVAATEIADAGKRVVVVDQEAEQNLGGQAFWSLGGLFMVDTPEQRRFRIKDSYDLALSDWIGTAGFDRPEDHWPRQWAEAYVAFAAGEMRPWLQTARNELVSGRGWAERGGYGGFGHGNSVPRFHITWGSGPGVLAPFVRRARDAENAGRLRFRFRHRVDGLIVTNGTVEGIHGAVLEPIKPRARREKLAEANRRIRAACAGRDHRIRRHRRRHRSGAQELARAARHASQFMVQGVPDYVDGRMLTISEAAGARVINGDRMWHYTEGLRNWNPIWTNHGIRILPGPSSLWLDATGKRLPPPLFPGFDTLGTLEHIMKTGHDYSWFVLNQRIIQKEFALSGSEQNPDFVNKDWRAVIARGRAKRATPPVEAFKEHGADFIVAGSLDELVRRMNELDRQAT